MLYKYSSMTTINETLDKIMQLDIPSREMLM